MKLRGGMCKRGFRRKITKGASGSEDYLTVENVRKGASVQISNRKKKKVRSRAANETTEDSASQADRLFLKKGRGEPQRESEESRKTVQGEERQRRGRAYERSILEEKGTGTKGVKGRAA